MRRRSRRAAFAWALPADNRASPDFRQATWQREQIERTLLGPSGSSRYFRIAPLFSLPTANVFKRTERDSNPRYPFGYAGFQDRCLKPLGHPSQVPILWDAGRVGDPSRNPKSFQIFFDYSHLVHSF